jgi:hypothetical protein
MPKLTLIAAAERTVQRLLAAKRAVRRLLAAIRRVLRTRFTLVLSPNEISFAHGTGVLLTRLVDNRDNVILMRSRTSYGGKQILPALKAFVVA